MAVQLEVPETIQHTEALHQSLEVFALNGLNLAPKKLEGDKPDMLLSKPDYFRGKK